jgi:superfamily II DNA or RNA helicase
MVWDQRTRLFRAPAHCYRDLVLALKSGGYDLADDARDYGPLALALRHPIMPREHQAKALKAWVDGGRRGVVQLPTGAGKTFLAVLALVQTGRPALIVVPTIDLLHQWQEVLRHFLGTQIGALGGGEREIRPLTVSTYDSAVLHAERLGNRFGLLIVDECHHLPAPQYRVIALGAIAPFRLGLSATVERADGRETEIFDLLGPLVYEGRIDQMVSTVLAPYDVVSIQVPLTPEETAAYQEARALYTAFLRRAGVDFSSPQGWMDFVRRAARMPGGKEAMRAYRDQKRLAQASSAKLTELWRILGDHRDDRVIVFTDDNAMAYRIGCEFALPVLTHQTRLPERKRMLAAFRAGELSAIVTSKVLNEGVDVPEARVGVVISGSGAVREHVQRLGRILRHRPGKRAVLYELVSKGTSEYYVNQRRKQHHAYKGSPEISS